MTRGIDRRQFLVLSSAGLLLGIHGTGLAAAPEGLVQRFLAIAPDGTVTVYAKHLDMGQGIYSGLAAIIAEELDADWAKVRVVGAPAKLPDYTHTMFVGQATGGSTSIANSWDQLREAGAVARAMIVAAAAARWNVAPGAVTIGKGRVAGGGLDDDIGAFAAAAAMLPVPALAKPKAPADYRLLGRVRPRLDIPDKTRGRQRYGIDTDWPGIKALVVAHPPRFGARLVRFDAGASRALPGVLAIERIPDGVAVIAETTWHALRARDALQIEWDERHVEQRSSEALFADFAERIARQQPTAVQTIGHPAAALADPANRIVESWFEFPYLAHAALEPISVAGRIEGGKCYVRGGFQSQTANQNTVAQILGLPIDRVFLETVPAGGSFGRRAAMGGPDWIDELAHALKATGGRWPLRLTWSRSDDIQGGRYRPMTVHRYRAALNACGDLLALDHGIAGQSCFPGLPQTSTPAPSIGVVVGHFADQYAVPDSRLAWWDPDAGVPAHTYRAVTNNHTGVSKEIFVDRLARAAGIDPVAYRLKLLGREPRQQAVLQLAAQHIGWSTPPPPGRTRGVAVHRADNSYVAQIVELSGTAQDFRIERVVAAVDCGRVLDPDTVAAQIEGGTGFGLSSALYQAIELDATGRVTQSNFHDYRVMRISEMPRSIETHIVHSKAAPTGIGEPGSVPVVAAVVNALERMGRPPVRRFPVLSGNAA